MINRIKKFHLCIGCGLCSSVLGRKTCKMELGSDGFYHPVVEKVLSSKDERKVKRLCPGIHIEAEKHEGIWGAIRSACEAWSADPQIRHKAASGGVVTTLAIYALESSMADAILQVGVTEDSYLYNELKVSRTKDEVIKNAQSRYAPALTLYNIKQILDDSDDKYVFIGKPCDIAGVKNLCRLFPKYESRFVLLISIFCAGMPTYNATDNVWRLSGRTDAPTTLKYRGDGWPGNFHAIWPDGQKFKMSYNDSWGKLLGRQLDFRCKICPDGIGMLADVAVGDSWNTKNGYPDFAEADGRSFVLIRTNRGNKAMQDAIASGNIVSRDLNIEHIKDIQSYQYSRRKVVGWRLLPVQLFTGFILDYHGLGIWRQALKANKLDGLRNLVGTIKRMSRLK